jgi:hypothetical protein
LVKETNPLLADDVVKQAWWNGAQIGKITCRDRGRLRS